MISLKICGFLIKNHKEEQYKGFRKFVLGQKFISIDDAIITLLKRHNMRRFFAIPLTKKILKILLRILPSKLLLGIASVSKNMTLIMSPSLILRLSNLKVMPSH